MIPTPDLSHLTSKDYEDVYEPAEDTFLLLDALEIDEDILKRSRPQVCLEIGSGSGCVSTFVGKILGPSVLYLCTDINLKACRSTLKTGVQNNVILDPLHTYLSGPLSNRLRNSVDIIVFNPPYVPTSEMEAAVAQDSGNIAGAWAGGFNGMQVTDIFLEQVKGLLSPAGRFYLVALKQNDVSGIRQKMQNIHGLKSDIVLQRRAGREYLFILRFVHENTTLY